METLYDILEVSRKASKEVIEKAYKTLAKKYHPDLQTAENKEIAEKRMKEINEAYDVLSDEQKRKEYDEKLEAEDERKKQEEYINYQNNSGTQNVRYESNMQTSGSDNSGNYSNPNNYSNQDFDWRKAYANLSKKEQHKIMKEVQKEANAEYRKQYEDYFDCTKVIIANVTYYINDGTDNPYFVDEVSDSVVNVIPPTPYREGYKFTNWYKEKECINLWDFEKDKVPKIKYDSNGNEIYEEMKIYAGWEEE